MPIISWSIILYLDGTPIGSVYYVSRECYWCWEIQDNSFNIKPKKGICFDCYPGKSIEAAEKYVEDNLVKNDSKMLKLLPNRL